MGQLVLRCVMCERGKEDGLVLEDFGVDQWSGAMVCSDCYTSPSKNTASGGSDMAARGIDVNNQQGLALQRAQARAAAAKRKTR
jgi:hypothetical protein